jgi:uncharacterized protein
LPPPRRLRQARRGSGGLESEAGTQQAGTHPQPSGSPPVNKGSGGLKSEAGTQVVGDHLEPSGSPPVNREPRGILELADWRERVAAAYLAEPRAGEAGWEAWRRARDQLFLTHPSSALTAEQRRRLVGLPWFPYEPAARVEARLGAPEGDGELAIDTGGEDGTVRYRRVGRLATPFGDLTLFWALGYGGGLFLPFRDATAGRETYGAGRYLTDTIKGTFGRGLVLDGDRAVLDFNYAYNPSCAYDPRWACPLAPPENWLAAPVHAGERVLPQEG